MTAKRLGKKTGPKPKFTESDVIDAAFKVGIAEFTLSQVAAELGVATSAVYRLFDSRSDLVHACLARAARELEKPIPSGMDWPDIFRDWANRCWELFDRYPGLSLTIMQHPSAFIHLESYFELLVRGLQDAGLSADTAAFGLDFIGDTVVATHISVRALSEPSVEGTTSEWDVLMQHQNPNAVFKPEESWKNRGFLDAKIEFIIEGIARA